MSITMARSQTEIVHPGSRHGFDDAESCASCQGEPTLTVVDLFAGEMNWSRPASDRSHVTWSSDFDPVYGTDHVGDARELRGQTILDAVGPVDLLLASPPCQGFTVARIGRNWNHDRTPKTAKAELGMELVASVLRIVEEVKPTYWLMENPVGMLRKLPLVAGLPHRSVTYCSYGRKFRKPTDLWGDAPPSMRFEPMCDAYASKVKVTASDGVEWCCSRSTGLPCHVASPRGSTTGVQGHKRLESTAIPYPLAWDVTVAAEADVMAGGQRSEGPSQGTLGWKM